jgi:hypothetical protein
MIDDLGTIDILRYQSEARMLAPSRFQHEAEEGVVLLDRYHDSCPNSKPLSQEDRQVYLTLIDAPRAVRYLTCRGGVISPDRLRPRDYNSRTPHGVVVYDSAIRVPKLLGGLFKFEALSVMRSKKSCDRVARRVEFELGSLIIPLTGMSDLYTSLHISPKKKRLLSDDEDDTSLTPKRLRPAYVNHLPLFRRFSSDGDKVHSRPQRRLKQIGQRLEVPLKPSLILFFLHICHDSSRFRLPCNMLSPMLLPHPLSHPLPKLGFYEM